MTTAADISDDERRAILSDLALRDGLRTIGRQNPYNSERLMSLEILALRSALTARERQEWQPIASAPVNVPVLVSGLHTDDSGRWVVLAIQDGSTWFRCYLDGRHNGTEVMPPTHWITPPKEPK